MSIRTATSQAAHGGLVVHLSVADLERMIESAVSRALEAQAPKPDYLDRNGVAQELGISVATVARLMKLGMPHLRVGDSPRFRLADVQRWLEERAKGPER